MGLVRMVRRLSVLAGLCVAAGCGAEAPSFVTVTDAADAVSLHITDGGYVFADRLAGVVRLQRISGGPAADLARVAVGTAGEQRGLLGVVELDDHIYAAWTEPGSLRLVVGQLTPERRLVWSGTDTQTKAIGGHLEVRDSKLLIGLGELTGWAKQHGSGALVTLDPLGSAEQQPVVLTDGWHNPFAFVVAADGAVWVADNAPDGGAERIGRGDVAGQTVELPGPQRAPAAIAVFGDGQLGVCGFLDGELRRYEVVAGEQLAVERRGTVTAGCRTGLAVAVTGGGDTIAVIGDGVLRVRGCCTK
jgi:hypothetical protein